MYHSLGVTKPNGGKILKTVKKVLANGFKPVIMMCMELTSMIKITLNGMTDDGKLPNHYQVTVRAADGTAQEISLLAGSAREARKLARQQGFKVVGKQARVV